MTERAAGRDDDDERQPLSTRSLLPQRLARIARRMTLAVAAAAFGLFVIRYETLWVPAGMNTIDAIPGGSWVIVDAWRSGMRIGSDVFVETAHGEIVSRVEQLTADAVTLRNPNPSATWGDSRVFGAVPVDDVRGTIVAVFPPDDHGRGR